MVEYGQWLRGAGGDLAYAVNCKTKEGAIKSATRFAFIAGMRPPRWFEFWRPRWPEECIREFNALKAREVGGG